MKEIIITSILFAVSVFLFFMSVRSFMEKGFLFNIHPENCGIHRLCGS